MTGSGFAIAESIVFILMLFLPPQRDILPFRSTSPDRCGASTSRESGDRRGAKKQDFVARSGSGAGGKKSARFCCAIYREP